MNKKEIVPIQFSNSNQKQASDSKPKLACRIKLGEKEVFIYNGELIQNIGI